MISSLDGQHRRVLIVSRTYQIFPCAHKTRGMAINTSMLCGSSCHNTHHPEDGIKVLQVLSNIVPQIWCNLAWMNIISVYWLCPMLGRPCLCNHKSCGMNGNISITCGSSHHNAHNLTIALKFYRYCQIWSHSLDSIWLGWTLSQCIDCVPGFSDIAHSFARCVKWIVTDLWHVVLRVTTDTTLKIAWWFCKYWQIWSDSLDAIGLGWTASKFTDYVPGFSDIVHISTKYVEWVATHLWYEVLCIT